MLTRTLHPLAALVLALGFAGAASAVIIDSGDGTGNTTAPSPDPGWAYVGLRAGAFTVVYLQDGWVLTANHVGAADVVLNGVTYSRVPGNEHRLSNGDGSYADLLMFAITPHPPLAPLPIAASTPANGASLILIGRGYNRGAATSWDPDPGPPPSTIYGYLWGVGTIKRWGTNFVEYFPPTRIVGTEAFGSYFDENDSAHEAQVAVGDSGGATFLWTGSSWELAGILFALGSFIGQPASTALYGNVSYSANLSFYRDEILDVIAMPEPSGGVWPAVALLAALRRPRLSRSTRRTCAGARPRR